MTFLVVFSRDESQWLDDEAHRLRIERVSRDERRTTNDERVLIL
jgi:hypothetical protein